jgi:hypothetical protein
MSERKITFTNSEDYIDSKKVKLYNGDLIYTLGKTYMVTTYGREMDPKSHMLCTLVNLQHGGRPFSGCKLERTTTMTEVARCLVQDFMGDYLPPNEIKIIPIECYDINIIVKKGSEHNASELG